MDRGLNGAPVGGTAPGTAVPRRPRDDARVAPSATVWWDAVAVAVFTLAVWATAVHFELFERYLRLTVRFENWQVDEMVFVTTALACGLSWLALRRWRDARQASHLHAAAERRVAELLAHNRELAQQLISVQETERRALARELHDEVGQSCSAIRVEAALVDRAALVDPAGARAAAQRIEATADGLHQCVRGMLRRLRPADLDALGLLGAIQSLCERWETSSGVACVFHHDGAAPAWSALNDATAVTVFRVAQEALANVMRHARASQVRVALSLRADANAGNDAGAGAADDVDRGAGTRLELLVQDDGVGMTATVADSGLGLLGARERAALLGGELRIDSAPGRGTRLHMVLPVGAPR